MPACVDGFDLGRIGNRTSGASSAWKLVPKMLWSELHHRPASGWSAASSSSPLSRVRRSFSYAIRSGGGLGDREGVVGEIGRRTAGAPQNRVQ